jgi:hypothetical protein
MAVARPIGLIRQFFDPDATGLVCHFGRRERVVAGNGLIAGIGPSPAAAGAHPEARPGAGPETDELLSMTIDVVNNIIPGYDAALRCAGQRARRDK